MRFLTALIAVVIVVLLFGATPGGRAPHRSVHLQTAAAHAAPVNSATATKFDYVIILAYNDFAAAVDTLKAWKERLGYSVKVVTVNEIFALYPSGDDAEKIWNFLHDRYDPNNWAIRYVLLVGDIDRIPIRMLYPDDKGLAYGSDYYYANLDTPDWDLDGDNRWGEFNDDDFDVHAEVIVGRIPVDNAAAVRTICENIVAFERDVGAWKRSALLAHGTMDYRTPGVKSDQAVLAERLKTDFFGPLGFTTHTLYEEGGIDPTTYVPDDSLCQANYENNCGLETHGVVSCNAHGAVDRFASYYWSGDWDGDGKWDPDGDTPELESTDYSKRGQIPGHPVSAITMLTGCNTAAIVGDDSLFAASTLRSRYLVRIPRDNTLAEVYLSSGAPATIGPTAGGDYSGPDWTGPDEDNWNTLSYFFFEHLLDEDKKAGDAFYEAQQDYADRHTLKRGIRDFNFFGDPSVRLKGVDNRPGGADRIVYEGTYQYYAAENDDNGDMYVGVITTEQEVAPGEIRVYKSADHGENWYLWSVVPTSDAVWTVDLLVSRYQDVALPDNRLHVIYSCRGGHVIDERIQLSDSTDSDTTALPSAGRWAVHVSAVRDPNPMPAPNTIYAVWEYDDSGTSKVRFAYSADNGETWVNAYNATERNTPDVDAGPAGRVYLTMVIDLFVADPDVVVVRSTDHGLSFGGEENLTAGDGSLGHYYPVVGASTNGSYPAVWVAYDYRTQTDQWGSESDLRCAYSPNAGGTWVKNRILSADLGVDEGHADLEGYRASANTYVNMAYNYDGFPNPDPRRQIMWRYANGSLPRSWSYYRVVNDYPAVAPQDFRPCLVYSPGTGPGSGVVYGGPDQHYLFFSAPWLTGPSPVNSPSYVSAAARPEMSDASGHDAASPAPAEIPPPLIWYEGGDLDGAFTLSSIIVAANGDLIAAGSARAEGSNHGAVYRSSDDGAVWQRLTDPPESWSVGCVLETESGALIAGGFVVYDPGSWAGIIYRSENGGASWDARLTYPQGTISEVIQAGDGSLWAVTGWNGEILRSTDDGLSWSTAAALGGGVLINDIIQTPLGDFLVALEGESAASPVMKSRNGYEWSGMEGLDEVTAAYDVISRGDEAVVAVTESGHGAVYIAAIAGMGWSRLPDLPADDVVAARSLAVGPGGRVIAGAERAWGPSDTYVFILPNDQGPWSEFGGMIDLATGVYRMATTETDIYAATGWVYGNVYRCSFDALTGIGDETPPLAAAFSVGSSYPNPFNPETVIPYHLESPERVSIVIYDVNGRLIRTIKAQTLESPGWHRAVWDGLDDNGNDAASGVYFYRLTAGRHGSTGKLTLVR